MKTPKLSLLLPLLLFTLSLSAQVQWYQNQDGNNVFPDGTYGTSLQSFNNTSFIACYQWSVNNDQYTWKISKTNLNGNEQRSFFLTGTVSSAEVKVGRYNSVYVLQRKFPIGQNAQYILYKLDHNLNVKAQRSITLPGNFNIVSLNAFELDESDNVYFAGDGQYPDASGYSSASFVMKLDKSLNLKWKKIEAAQTSFVRLHIDRHGRVIVLQDFYTFFPEVRITRITANGLYSVTMAVQTDPGRYNLFSKSDKDDNLFLYGGKMVGDTAQAMFLHKISMRTNRIIYSKTYFTAPGSQLNDFKLDKHGNIFSLVTQYFGPDDQVSKISRINASSGNIYWNRSFPFAQDSCILSKIIMDEDDRFYAIGEKRSNTYFSKGFAMQIKKNGSRENNFPAPDSVAFQRSHFLVDGIIDNNNQLIAIGNTNDFDTVTYSSTYFRSFAVRFGNKRCDNSFNKTENLLTTEAETVIKPEAEETVPAAVKLTIYPNPAQNQLTVANLNKDEYDNLAVYTMQGALILKQSVNGTIVRMNISNLTDGVYLLVLRSSVLLKEKSIKFVVRK